jgi:anaerobic selenocysteine-containing dehydrogenase
MRKKGELVPVSWDECLEDIALRLRNIVDTYGPNAIGFYFGSGLGMDASGYRMADTFYKSFGAPPKFSPLTIDGTAKVLVATLIGGFPGLNPKTDYDTVDMLLYLGVNPMVSHGHNTGMFNPAVSIRGTARRGEVWTIDPLFTETAKFSTRTTRPTPGRTTRSSRGWYTKSSMAAQSILPSPSRAWKSYARRLPASTVPLLPLLPV